MEGQRARYPEQAVVVCTRNRPDDVTRLIGSFLQQETSDPVRLVIVDASDPEEAKTVRTLTTSWADSGVEYLSYSDAPSLARQRNFGVEHLPEEVRIVHFLDDDVSLEPGYLETLASILRQDPSVGGVGGRVLELNNDRTASMWKRLASRFFLLESSQPGRVLPSGGLTGAQSVPLTSRMDVECLGGCATYRRDLVSQLRFDDRLEGYSMDEDLDFSYRAGRRAKLVVDPDARLVHHLSQSARHSIRESRRDLLVHRYWFVEKNIRHPLRKPAFWWKILGSFVMAALSRNPDAVEARKGIVDGARIAWNRTHRLLQPTD